ncbi:type III pantothenate kinase [Candidatus Omnitrophota bacterium]
MRDLLIDIGNTAVHYGLARKHGLVFTGKKNTKDFKLSLPKLIGRHKPKRVFICSVVPGVCKEIRRILKENDVSIFECGREIDIPVRNLYQRPHEVGQDRLINVFAAKALYKNIRLVIDLGTALTFDFISSRGEYLGGLIFPGMSTSLSGLLKNCALLPDKITLKSRVRLQGKSTSECVVSGIVLGYSFLVGGLMGHIKKGKKKPFKVLLTGGDCEFIKKDIAKVDYTDSRLSLKGLCELRYSIE